MRCSYMPEKCMNVARTERPTCRCDASRSRLAHGVMRNEDMAAELKGCVPACDPGTVGDGNGGGENIQKLAARVGASG